MNANNINLKKPEEFKEDWVSKGIGEECLDFLQGFGLYLVDKKSPHDDRPGRNAMTTSQLRNIFSEAKQIESKVKMAKSKNDQAENEWNKIIPRIHLLRPKIAYATARAMERDRDSRMKAFQQVADKALIEATKGLQNYLNFINILEAIIAYHKMYGGRDK